MPSGYADRDRVTMVAAPAKTSCRAQATRHIVVWYKQVNQSPPTQRFPMPVETFEQPAAARSAPSTAAARPPAVGKEDVEALTGAIRNLMLAAKARHRQLEKTSSDHGRVSVL